jgi:HK97 family phage portal protein
MAWSFFRRGGAVPDARPVEVKASATGRVVAWGASGRVAWSPRDVVSLTKTGFAGNPIGFRTVKLIAEAAAALPLICQDADRRYDLHPLLELMRRPNPGQGRAELFEALYGQILLSGNGYVEAVGGDGLPVELHVLRSDRMSLVPGADGWPVAYDYAVGGRKHRFDMTGPVDPVCHIKSFHPARRSLWTVALAGGGGGDRCA